MNSPWVASINGSVDTRITATFTTSDNKVTVKTCCPAVSTAQSMYTVTGNTVSVIDFENANRVITLTKQP